MTTFTEGRFEIFFEDPLYLLYKNHLYNYLVRRWVIRRRLKRSPVARVLELGCGISPMLSASQQTIRTDLSWRALAFLRKYSYKERQAPAVVCDAVHLPFRDGSLDHVVCSEVLEHIEEDGEVLEEIYRTLAPGGSLFLTCPIHPQYFGLDDELVGHYRRYETDSLKQRLSKTGFEEFEVHPILGPLEKVLMEKVARIYVRFKNGKRGVRAWSFLSRLLAWLVFLPYLAINYFLSVWVYLEAQAVRMEKVVTVGIHCRKGG